MEDRHVALTAQSAVNATWRATTGRTDGARTTMDGTDGWTDERTHDDDGEDWTVTTGRTRRDGRTIYIYIYIYIYGAAWNAVVLFLTMVMGKIGIASWPFWLKTRTRIDQEKVPLSEPWDYRHLGAVASRP